MAEAKRYLRKRQNLLAMVTKIKLWPSRKGFLHGVKDIRKTGAGFEITTHCGLVFNAADSANSRAARWLRAKQYTAPCPRCSVPDWKLSKYGATVFSKRQGRTLSVDLVPGADNNGKKK
jgi:pyrrolysyl-tRNA synthetase-like protein